MILGMIGLGRMGANMARRLAGGGHHIVALNRTPDKAEALARENLNIEAAISLPDLLGRLQSPRVVWVMVPAGQATEQTVAELLEVLRPGDAVVEGGNSNYRDSVRRASLARNRGVHFIDVGTSGGIWGLSAGYSLMIGGEKAAVERLRPLFEVLAPARDKGWGHVGPSGAGHFAKMVHNGIEYGLMQAYAEGFEILRSKTEFQLDLQQVAEIWRQGSVVRSWLLDLGADMLRRDPRLSEVKGWVADSGEGRWAVAEAIDLDVPAPVITLALMMRLASRQNESYAARFLAALRHQFGGHEVKKEA